MKYLSNPAALGLQYVEQWVRACKYIDKNDTNDDGYDDDDVIHDKPSSNISNGFVTVNVNFSRLFLITGFDKGAGCCALGEL